ncbi:DNA polymerase epsilon subunit D [Sphaceloma murrayae]|uniref:DNA polymerase epsilon subunit D n=1 Tax=Sphaceloma murrayae TaxID=2082308 RepID=A0A2K1QMU5_9PEZI|nr:DNA polymerase epsilon subunit D [Sphaceloma murrayae]
MPPRKSNVSTTTVEAGESGTPQASRSVRDGLSVEELNLPRTMVQRLAKGVLPSNTQIQKDALLAISKSATVFVNFLASNASEIAMSSGKKTIMPKDVFAALKENEFEAFLPRVEEETAKYHEIQCDKRNTYRRTKVAEKKAAAGGSVNGDAMDEDEQTKTNGTMAGGDEPPAKRARREHGVDVDDEPDDEADVEEVDDDVDEEDSAEEEVEDEEAEEEVGEEQEVDEIDEEGRANGIRDEALDEPDSD